MKGKWMGQVMMRLLTMLCVACVLAVLTVSLAFPPRRAEAATYAWSLEASTT